MAKSLLSFNSGYISLENEVAVELTQKGLVYAYQYTGFWCPIKTPCSLLYCNSFLIKLYQQYNNNNELIYDIKNETFIHSSSKISNTAVIGPNVSIGKNCEIGEGTRISNAIIGDNVVIGVLI